MGKPGSLFHRFSVVLVDIIDFVFYVFVYIILPIIFVLVCFVSHANLWEN
jgi:uncharacterized protein YqhQ